jgi:hypothetical protein
MVSEYIVKRRTVIELVKSSVNGEERLRSQSMKEMRKVAWSHDKRMKIARYFFTRCK